MKPIYLSGFSIFIIAATFFLQSCEPAKKQAEYTGKPYQDSVYQAGPQTIPGKLQCEYYDLGGEGIAFHDADSVNSGSGALNLADGSYLNEFRKNEAVDISYTKFYLNAVDNSPYNFVEPEKDQLYIGWTKEGEWTKYTVNVLDSGLYKLGLMYTSNNGGKISVSVNDSDATGEIEIPSTFVEADTVAWRQWHHWNYLENMAQIKLEQGIQTITLHTVEYGDMNYDYISFERVDK